MTPETRYALSGDVSIAYQVVGEGPLDLIVVFGFASNVEILWEFDQTRRFFERLASFSRLIIFDKRGTGLSDPVPAGASIEERMDDVRAVMDAAGSEKAAVFGYSEGGPMSAVFAATYPERTTALIMYGAGARFPIEDTGFGRYGNNVDDIVRLVREHWGEGWPGLEVWAPSIAPYEEARRMWARAWRQSLSPKAMEEMLRWVATIDVRDILPTIHVPTLVLHRRDETAVPIRRGRELAAGIPGAKFVELEGIDHMPWIGDQEALVDEIQEFVTGRRPKPDPDRVLATVMFTDIVDSTRRAQEMGDQRWRSVLEEHNNLVRRGLAEHRGMEVKQTGDGFLATFDGPARGIRCASELVRAMHATGIEIRAGLHSGECERLGGDLGGIAVHIAARVAEAAAPGEVLVSSTVRDLVTGSGISFEARGRRTLKGVPGRWPLFAPAA
jgi:class 3 adenylate cyclase/alpha-beta hydrolase superfamily lysophospholipase